jgi:hypothetical protein
MLLSVLAMKGQGAARNRNVSRSPRGDAPPTQQTISEGLTLLAGFHHAVGGTDSAQG